MFYLIDQKVNDVSTENGANCIGEIIIKGYGIQKINITSVIKRGKVKVVISL